MTRAFGPPTTRALAPGPAEPPCRLHVVAPEYEADLLARALGAALFWDTQSAGSILAAVIDGGGGVGGDVFAVLAATAWRGGHWPDGPPRSVGAALAAEPRGRLGSDRAAPRCRAAPGGPPPGRSSRRSTLRIRRPSGAWSALILEQGLTRFSSIVARDRRLVRVRVRRGDTRGLDSLLEGRFSSSTTRSARDAALSVRLGEDAYLALWAAAFESAPRPVPIAETLLSDVYPERRLAADSSSR